MSLSKKGQAKFAEKILAKKGVGFKIPTRDQKRILEIEFAKVEKAIYGKAYDIVKIKNNIDINLDDSEDVSSNIENIVLIEVKSTGQKRIKSDFRKYFFDLTTAELLVAQNLKDQYRFVFVHVDTEDYKEMSLQEVYAYSRAIYPKWAVLF